MKRRGFIQGLGGLVAGLGLLKTLEPKSAGGEVAGRQGAPFVGPSETFSAAPVPMADAGAHVIEHRPLRFQMTFSEQLRELRRLHREGQLNDASLANLGWTSANSSAQDMRAAEEFSAVHDFMMSNKRIEAKEDDPAWEDDG